MRHGLVVLLLDGAVIKGGKFAFLGHLFEFWNFLPWEFRGKPDGPLFFFFFSFLNFFLSTAGSPDMSMGELDRRAVTSFIFFSTSKI